MRDILRDLDRQDSSSDPVLVFHTRRSGGKCYATLRLGEGRRDPALLSGEGRHGA